MRDDSSRAINSLFGIAAVLGILLLLPGTALAVSVPRMSESAAIMPDAGADIAAIAGCALLEPAAGQAAQEGGPECENKDGSPRDCTASEEFLQCAADAHDAVDQCHEDARNFVDHAFCEFGWTIDAMACIADLTEEVTPFLDALTRK